MVDPREILDSIGDGAIEVLQLGSRIADRHGTAIHTYGISLRTIGNEIKAQMPDNPAVLPTSAVRIAEATVKLVVDGAGAIAESVQETGAKVKSQIERVTRR